MGLPAFLWLIALPLIAAPVIYLAGRLGSRLTRWPLAYLAALLALLGTWAPFVAAASQFARSGTLAYTLGAVPLQLDGLSLLLAAVALGLGTFVALYSGPYIGGALGAEKYYAMLTAMVGVIIGLGCAADLFNLWLWFEAMAVTSYLLVTFYRDEPLSLEAGVKYVVQSAAGSVLALMGISLVLAQTGSLNLAEIRAAAAPAPAWLAAGALFVIGFGVKAALIPMHTWLPDAHSQAPSGISAMLSGVVIEAGLVALLRSVLVLPDAGGAWPVLLMGFGAVNMLGGNLMALRQKQVKRLLAYSSLAHVGYMLAGLGITLYSGEALGAQGGLFHLLNHGLMKGLAFLSAGALLYAVGLSLGDHAALTVADLAGASRRYPLAALCLSLAVLGLGGLPPLAGFMSKWQIFVAGFQTRNLWIEALVAFAALNSVLSLAYYAPLVNAVYRHEPSPRVRQGGAMPAALQLPLAVLALLVVALGLWPGLVSGLTAPAGAVLLRALGG
jgi:proton-translocating NADH-quinone oxidoreductase chain N